MAGTPGYWGQLKRRKKMVIAAGKKEVARPGKTLWLWAFAKTGKEMGNEGTQQDMGNPLAGKAPNKPVVYDEIGCSKE